jgi:hypothetical protein
VPICRIRFSSLKKSVTPSNGLSLAFGHLASPSLAGVGIERPLQAHVSQEAPGHLTLVLALGHGGVHLHDLGAGQPPVDRVDNQQELLPPDALRNERSSTPKCWRVNSTLRASVASPSRGVSSKRGS